MRFEGNVEGTDLLAGGVDVVVTDGFTGNIALKTIEGVSQAVVGAIRDAAMASIRGRAGGLLLRAGLRRFRDEIDPERAGGAYLLGLRCVGVVAHGRFSRAGFARAIAVAERGVRERVVERTHVALDAAGALRRSSSESPISLSAPP
jgi:glycerol-3-phosphate acyltransferase PlsX